MNQAERIIKEHFQENWRKWVSTLICALLLWCITTWAQSWIVNTTKIYLASEEGQQKIFETMKDSYKNAIGASYSAHFVLGKKRNAFEHSIPIYVTDGSPTKLYLEMVQSLASALL